MLPLVCTCGHAAQFRPPSFSIHDSTPETDDVEMFWHIDKRLPLNLRTRIKRLVRRTLCFSKTEHMHDLVMGLFINRYEFGRPL
jgi:hypothetical protein